MNILACRSRAMFAAGLVVLLAGCREPVKTDDTAAERPFAGVELKILVVDDAPLAGAIEQNHGEWRARTDGTYTVDQVTSAELLAREKLGADVVIYADALLPELAERGWLMPVDDSVVSDPQMQWPDVFDMLQLDVTRWDETTYAAPLGSPLLACLYRRDLFDATGKTPPTTWDEFNELSAFFADPANWPESLRRDTVRGSVEPLAGHWASVTLLARAAGYAKHRDQYSTFFDLRTGEPLIDTPPMVRALEELVAANRSSGDEAAGAPDVVLDTFLKGNVAMAITWPTSAATTPDDEPETDGAATTTLDIGVVPLPGSTVVFHQPTGEWQDRRDDEDPRVTLLGVAGRLASIASDSANASAAAQLIVTLCGPEQVTTLATSSKACTLSRVSQTKSLAPWTTDRLDTAVIGQYAEQLHERLTMSPHCFALRLPDRDAYLTTLDNAVNEALAGAKSPQDALGEVAAEWRAIAQRAGDDHRLMLRRNLGLSE